MAETKPNTRLAIVTSKVLRLLDALQKTDEGSIIYAHLQDMLADFEISSIEIQQAYADFLKELLDIFATQQPTDSTLLIQIRMLQARLTPPLTISELTGLRNYLSKLINTKSLNTKTNEHALEKVLNPLLKSFGISSPNFRQTPIEPSTKSTQESDITSPDITPATPELNRRVDITYRQHLDEKRERILKIQEILTHHVSEVVIQNEQFGVLLEVELEALQQTNDLEDIKLLKQTLINEVEKLLKGQNDLAYKLDSANKYLQIIETEGQHLNEELARVHILSLTDELTELPNRRAFLRRLEDEVARVQRYGYPLTVSLIDLDSFKSINDQHGHAAGDEVLNNFAANILSTFRHHDMVARYGGEEFAVILPNTDIEGAMRALNKVRNKASKTSYEYNGVTRPMPTFSAGLSLYKPGETPSNLIERADKALYQAKNSGRNRVEVAELDNIESTESHSS